jgi:hypothetical protein
LDDYSSKSLIYRYYFLNFEKMANCENNQKTNIMKTEKETYESPFTEILIEEMESLICHSMTETVDDDPEDIVWDE